MIINFSLSMNDGCDGVFELFTERDDDDRFFGRFQVAPGKTAQLGDDLLTVELRENDTVLARFLPILTWRRKPSGRLSIEKHKALLKVIIG